jgi:hypothetical protein
MVGNVGAQQRLGYKERVLAPFVMTELGSRYNIQGHKTTRTSVFVIHRGKVFQYQTLGSLLSH